MVTKNKLLCALMLAFFNVGVMGMQQQRFQATDADFDFMLAFIGDKEKDIIKNSTNNSYDINLGPNRTGVVAGNNQKLFKAYGRLKYKNDPNAIKIKFNESQAQQLYERMADLYSRQGPKKEKTIEE